MPLTWWGGGYGGLELGPPPGPPGVGYRCGYGEYWPPPGGIWDPDCGGPPGCGGYGPGDWPIGGYGDCPLDELV